MNYPKIEFPDQLTKKPTHWYEKIMIFINHIYIEMIKKYYRSPDNYREQRFYMSK